RLPTRRHAIPIMTANAEAAANASCAVVTVRHRASDDITGAAPLAGCSSNGALLVSREWSCALPFQRLLVQPLPLLALQCKVPFGQQPASAAPREKETAHGNCCPEGRPEVNLPHN